mmetsp:Transcript_19974/g.56751  ORF Transcript_19974/g.56751 Transcript_19974/m.56751 type:complete len:260 (+) Transcript_19974:757-1536(+)
MRRRLERLLTNRGERLLDDGARRRLALGHQSVILLAQRALDEGGPILLQHIAGDGHGPELALVHIDHSTIHAHARHVDADHAALNAVDGRGPEGLGLLERLAHERRDRRADDRRRGAVDGLERPTQSQAPGRARRGGGDNCTTPHGPLDELRRALPWLRAEERHGEMRRDLLSVQVVAGLLDGAEVGLLGHRGLEAIDRAERRAGREDLVAAPRADLRAGEVGLGRALRGLLARPLEELRRIVDLERRGAGARLLGVKR